MSTARPGRAPAWLLWIVLSIIGAAVGSVVAWWVRSLVTVPAPTFLLDNLRYLGVVAEASLLAGAQWLLLRRHGVDVAWIPATVAASLIADVVVVPRVLSLFIGSFSSPPNPGTPILAGATALAASGLLLGFAQWLILRWNHGRDSWPWIPATAIGGAIVGAGTTWMSPQLQGLPLVVLLACLAAVGGGLRALVQAPVLERYVVRPGQARAGA